MNLKILFGLFGFSISVSAYPRQAVLLKPKEEIVQLCFIDEAHPKDEMLQSSQNPFSYIDKVTNVLKKAEKNGMPFHVLIEKVNPIEEYYCKKDKKPRSLLTDLKYRTLLTDLWFLGQTKIPNTPIESIETRKKTGYALNIWQSSEPIMVLFPFVSNPQDINDYIDKDVFDLTFQDLFDELNTMMETAHKVKKLCKNAPALYRHLEEKIIKLDKRYKDFKENLLSYGYQSDQYIHSISAHRTIIREELSKISSRLFNFYELKRILELQYDAKNQNTSKNILVIAGGYHNRKIRRWLALTDKYSILKQAKPHETTLAEDQTAVPDEFLVLMLQTCFHDLLKQELLAREKERILLAIPELYKLDPIIFCEIRMYRDSKQEKTFFVI